MIGATVAATIAINAAFLNTNVPYNDVIASSNFNPMVPVKIDMKNNLCHKRTVDNKDACIKVFGEDVFRPVRKNDFYAGPTGCQAFD